jgi:hypothetical protein
MVTKNLLGLQTREPSERVVQKFSELPPKNTHRHYDRQHPKRIGPLKEEVFTRPDTNHAQRCLQRSISNWCLQRAIAAGVRWREL